MERLVDPLTTTDAKLWADEFMKVKARLGEQKFDHAMMLGWFANAIMQGYDEGRRRAKADAQATVEALQAQLVTLKRHADLDCGDQSCLYAMNHGGMRTNGGCRCNPKRMKEDLQRAQAALDVAREKVAAVAKERDVQCTLKQNCISMLEQEREKVKGLHEITKVICTHCCEPMEIPSKAVLQTQLTQLQALVRDKGGADGKAEGI